MKYLFFLIFILSFNLKSKAQDIIIKNSNDTIKCLIVKDDNLFLYYVLVNDTIIQKIKHDEYSYFKRRSDISNKEIKKDTSQSYPVEKRVIPFFHAGYGLGINYGGIGGRIDISPARQFRLYLGLGFNYSDAPGINIGARLNLLDERKYINPYFGVMYGYNTVVMIKNYLNNIETTEVEVFYGFSFEFGIELYSNSHRNFFNIGLILPVRSEDYYNLNVEYTQKPWFMLPSIGYHIGVGK